MKISDRSKSILSNTKFLIKDLNESQSLIFEISNKRLRILFKEERNELENLVHETLAILLNNREISFLLKLTFREFESFLRDNNVNEAFDSDTHHIVEKLFQKNINLLFQKYLHSLKEYSSVINFQLMDKIRFIDQIFECMNVDLDLKKQFNFVHLEYEYIYFRGHIGESHSDAIGILEEFFSNCMNSPFKMVAQSI